MRLGKKYIHLQTSRSSNMIKKNDKKNEREKKIREIKRRIKNGSYNWEEAIEDTAEKILNYPQALLWR